MLETRKAQNFCHHGIIFQLKCQIRQRREASKMAIDKRSKDRLFRKQRTSPLFGGFFHRRQVFEKFLIADTWRKVFGIEKRKWFHDTLEFCDRCVKNTLLRVSKCQTLGYLIPSYQKRWMLFGSRVSQKSFFLTCSFLGLKNMEIWAFSRSKELINC